MKNLTFRWDTIPYRDVVRNGLSTGVHGRVYAEKGNIYK